MEWCRQQDLPWQDLPCLYEECTSELFEEHVQEAGLIRPSALDRFVVIEFPLLRVAKASTSSLSALCPRVVSTLRRSVCHAMSTIGDVELFLRGESGTGFLSRVKTAVDVAHLIVSHSLVLPRFSRPLQLLLSCFQFNFEKQFVSPVANNSYRN